MISGNSIAKAFVIAALLGVAPARAEEPVSLDTLMKARQAIASSSASFTETRTLSMLNEPIKSTGTLRYVAPNHLERHTMTPQDETLIVTGDQVTYTQGTAKSRSFSLADSPEMSALIESIRATLAGDEAALNEHYTVLVQGTRGAWQMLLTPKAPKVQAFVDSIRIAGEGVHPKTIDTVEHGGDRTVMIITETGP